MFTNDHNKVTDCAIAMLPFFPLREKGRFDKGTSLLVYIVRCTKQGSLELLLNTIPIVSHPHRRVLPLLSLLPHLIKLQEDLEGIILSDNSQFVLRA
jgi:hypothetical protein